MSDRALVPGPTRWRLAVSGAVLSGALLGVGVPVQALTPLPPEAQEQCARFVELQDAMDAVRVQSTSTKSFASIRKAARVFRRVAKQVPDAVRDEMALLAASISDLDRALRPFASKVQRVDDAEEYEDLLAEVQDAFTGWVEDQDAEALGEAQAAVDDWLEATCGFRLGPETVAPSGRGS